MSSDLVSFPRFYTDFRALEKIAYENTANNFSINSIPVNQVLLNLLRQKLFSNPFTPFNHLHG